MQLDIREALLQRRPFVGFLHAVLAEHALARFDHRKNILDPERLADGHQRDRSRIAPVAERGLADFRADDFEPRGARVQIGGQDSLLCSAAF
jgi:hypothetical protein